jgi:hypothetical protein
MSSPAVVIDEHGNVQPVGLHGPESGVPPRPLNLRGVLEP